MLYSRLHGAYFNHRKRNSTACPGSIAISNSKCWSRVHNRAVRPWCGKKASNILWQNHIKFENVQSELEYSILYITFLVLRKRKWFRRNSKKAGVCVSRSLQNISEVTKSQRNRRRQRRLQIFQKNSTFKAVKIKIK